MVEELAKYLPEEQKKFAAWRRTLPEEETGEKEPT